MKTGYKILSVLSVIILYSLFTQSVLASTGFQSETVGSSDWSTYFVDDTNSMAAVCLYDPNGVASIDAAGLCDSNNSFPAYVSGLPLTVGTWHAYFTTNGGDCTGLSETGCAAIASFSDSYTINATSNGDFGSIINVASVGFASTTGFNISAVAQWAGDNLIKLFIGSGLALLIGLRYWIVGLLIIGAVIAFSYRAFRFFRH